VNQRESGRQSSLSPTTINNLYRHARKIKQLGQEVMLLPESGRLASCQVILGDGGNSRINCQQ
jgi:hypothetical protein